MGRRALLVTTVSGFVPQFEMNSVELLQKGGYEVHYATNYNNVFYGKDNSRLDGTGIIRHQIDFTRSPYSKQTITAYKQLESLMNQIQFDVVHCHTPMGSFLARLVGHKLNVPQIIYTAHGFHFYKGAPVINNLIYRTVEKYMARYTDAILTINEEDYQNALKFKLRNGGRIYKIAGAGIDTKLFMDNSDSGKSIRKELGFSDDDYVVLSVGELNVNKNQEVIIRAISELKEQRIKYIVCGEGNNKDYLKKLVYDLNLEKQVYLLGFRKDIPDVCHAADLYVFPSHREGLPVAMMEAMASGLPVLASNVRGNIDLIHDGVNGYLIPPDNYEQWAKKISYLFKNCSIGKEMGQRNVEMIQKYDRSAVRSQLFEIYRRQGVL